MQTFQTMAQISDDRTLTVVVPPDFPKGEVRVVVTPVTEPELPYIEGEIDGVKYTQGKLPRTSLAEWAEQNAEHWGDQIRSDDVEGFTGRRF
jgi:hypothetical protein